MKQLNKKGQGIFDNLAAIGIGVVGLAIILIVTFLIMSTGKEAVVTQMTPATFAESTVTLTNATTTTFSNCIRDEDMVVTAIRNGSITDSIIMVPGNYTVSSNTVTVLTYLESYTPLTNISYSCKGGNNAYNATETLQNATDTVPTWIPIVVITLIGGILIGAVKMFRR